MLTLEDLTKRNPQAILATYLVGSRAYGTSTPQSDEDYRGIFMLPGRAYLSTVEPVTQLADERNNTTYYTLKRFLELAATANPNIIEMLFMPDDCVVFESPLIKPLLDKKSLFVTKQAYQSHVGYAMAQIKRAKGQNKWINNPQPEMPPMPEQFCWFIPRENGTDDVFPYRPIPLQETEIDLSHCACAALEHVTQTYRLYDYSDQNRQGVFRNGMLVCESIPKDDETKRCIGLLIYDRTVYERAKRDHENYWTWRKNRNDSRWQSQERGERDFDAKNMLHTFRLLLSGENIPREGFPLVRFEGDRLRLLLDIRDGIYSYEELIRMADERFESLHETFLRSTLPEDVDRRMIDAILREITADWEKGHAAS